jgi:hypothetical protein
MSGRIEVRHIAKAVGEDLIYDLPDNECVHAAHVDTAVAYYHLWLVVEVKEKRLTRRQRRRELH